MREIQFTDAKAALGNLIDDAVAGEPSVILRDGRKAAVLLSHAEYERLRRRPSFGELLAAFPGDESDLPNRR